MSTLRPSVELMHPDYWLRLDAYVDRELAAYRTFGAIAIEAGIADVRDIRVGVGPKSHTATQVTYNTLDVADGPDIRSISLKELRHNSAGYQIVQPKFVADRIVAWDDPELPIGLHQAPAVETLYPRPTMKVRKADQVTTLASLNQLLCGDITDMERDQDTYLRWLYVVRTSLHIGVQ